MVDVTKSFSKQDLRDLIAVANRLQNLKCGQEELGYINGLTERIFSDTNDEKRLLIQKNIESLIKSLEGESARDKSSEERECIINNFLQPDENDLHEFMRLIYDISIVVEEINSEYEFKAEVESLDAEEEQELLSEDEDGCTEEEQHVSYQSEILSKKSGDVVKLTIEIFINSLKSLEVVSQSKTPLLLKLSDIVINHLHNK